jgi:hypothetical protein
MNEQPTAIKLSETDIKKFRNLWLEKLGTEIDKKEAHKKLLLLVRQVELTYRKTPSEGVDNE